MGILDDLSGVEGSQEADRIKRMRGVERKGMRTEGVGQDGRRPPGRREEERTEAERQKDYKDNLALLADMVERFNQNLMAAGSDLRIRLWQTWDGCHIQFVREHDDALIHQTDLIRSADVDAGNIGKFIRDFTSERGVLIDVDDNAEKKATAGSGEPTKKTEAAAPRAAGGDITTLLIDAVARFNDDLQKKHPGFQVRLWDSGKGFHVQIVREHDDTVLNESELLLADDVTGKDIEDWINDFIREKGIFIDLEK